MGGETPQIMSAWWLVMFLRVMVIPFWQVREKIRLRAFTIPNKLITCLYITSDQALITGKGAAVCSLIRKHDHFTPTREIRQHVRALARNHPAGWKLQGHVSPQTHHRPSSAHSLRDFTTHYISCENLPAEATRLAVQISSGRVSMINT